MVGGSLDPIDIGPISISGYDAGTRAELAVTIGLSAQLIHISGGVQIIDFDTRIFLNATLQPTVTFDLKAELKFSTMLSFVLEANLKQGSFANIAALNQLEFEIYFLMEQEILDHVVEQVNLQIVAAKNSVDRGIESAQKTLDQAQKEYEADVTAAQSSVNAAQSTYEAKMAIVKGNLAAKTREISLQVAKLNQDVADALKAFDDALASAKNSLESTKQTTQSAIDNAQNDLQNAQAKATASVDQANRDLNGTINDMQNRFGSALRDMQNAQDDVNNKQRKYSFDFASCQFVH